MAPPKRPWFRFYTEALTDPKVRRLTPEERWLWVAILGAARQSPRPGWLMLTATIPLDFDDLAALAGMTVGRVVKGTDKMQDLGMIGYDTEVKAWFVPSWDDRQFESDDVAARTKKHRRKNTEAAPMERSINGDSGADGTPPETETENRGREQIDDDDFTVVRRPESSSDLDQRDVWFAYAQLVAESQAEPPAKLSAFLTSVARKAKRERGPRLAEYLRVCPAANTHTLAQWLFDDVDPVMLDRPELDDDFIPAADLKVVGQ